MFRRLAIRKVVKVANAASPNKLSAKPPFEEVSNTYVPIAEHATAVKDAIREYRN
jgi:hypothetical protein